MIAYQRWHLKPRNYATCVQRPSRKKICAKNRTRQAWLERAKLKHYSALTCKMPRRPRCVWQPPGGSGEPRFPRAGCGAWGEAEEAEEEEQPPARRPPARQRLAQQSLAEQPPAQRPPAKRPLTEQPPAQQPLAEQPSAQRPPAGAGRRLGRPGRSALTCGAEEKRGHGRAGRPCRKITHLYVSGCIRV